MSGVFGFFQVTVVEAKSIPQAKRMAKSADPYIEMVLDFSGVHGDGSDFVLKKTDGGNTNHIRTCVKVFKKYIYLSALVINKLLFLRCSVERNVSRMARIVYNFSSHVI